MDRDTPVVFLHAYPLDGSMWAQQATALSGRIIRTPSFPGFGGRPPGEPSLDHFAEAVIEEMDAEGIERAVFVGLSMGGYVAFRLHANRPDRVAGLVLADTRAAADDEAGRSKRTDQAKRAREEGVGWLADALIPSLLGATTRRERPDVVSDLRRRISSSNPEGVARALLAMRDRPDATAELAKIRVPVLALVGEEDELTPPSDARRIADGVPQGRLTVIPKAGHLANLEAPGFFEEALRGFLDEGR
jgi:pimeloyl-ACP methyl ester carboxylesterase